MDAVERRSNAVIDAVEPSKTPAHGPLPGVSTVRCQQWAHDPPRVVFGVHANE
jgi:hypothetical protein